MFNWILKIWRAIWRKKTPSMVGKTIYQKIAADETLPKETRQLAQAVVLHEKKKEERKAKRSSFWKKVHGRTLQQSLFKSY